VKLAVRVLLVAGVAPTLFAADLVTQSLREQMKVEQALLDRDVAQYEDERAQLQEVWVRVERESADLMQAQRQGESLESLQLRDEDLRKAESALIMHLHAMQQVRRSMLAGLATIAITEGAIGRLPDEVGVGDHPITGTWRVVMEPGGHEGLMALQLDGTLIQGTYRLSGDWTGSVRGTLVAEKVRLERIDSQMGFAAILHGRLQVQGETARLQGSWEATQLATGLPASGTWVAERVSELEE
jgi:hypothetical protein